MKKNIVIMGAAGRDFHNFNVHYRDDDTVNVVAFTATQIPDIHDRTYPPSLAGPLYPAGIPIRPEEDLPRLIRELKVDEVIFSYSDISHETVMHRASEALAAGASFTLLSPRDTMLKSKKPVISVCAVRTGCGKSPTTAYICSFLKAKHLKPVVVRHPMPYGNLEQQAVQRFAKMEDFDLHACTIEEREEYEHLVEGGITVFAGVDYEKILREAEKEADIVIWDGGNNDTPFFEPDLSIVVFDPLRAGHELAYHPGEVNLRMADVAVIGKTGSALPEEILEVKANIVNENPHARLVLADTPVSVDDPDAVKGKRVLAVEDGPTLTHGGMAYGAAVMAANRFKARETVDPRPYAVGDIKAALNGCAEIGCALPALGYSPRQIRELEETINRTDCDLVLFGTPINLERLVKINKPCMRVRYEYADIAEPTLAQVVEEFLAL